MESIDNVELNCRFLFSLKVRPLFVEREEPIGTLNNPTKGREEGPQKIYWIHFCRAYTFDNCEHKNIEKKREIYSFNWNHSLLLFVH